MYVCMYVCMYICMYVRMYVGMYACMQDSLGDQPQAEEILPVKNENLSIYLSIYLPP